MEGGETQVGFDVAGVELDGLLEVLLRRFPTTGILGEPLRPLNGSRVSASFNEATASK
jgi:hypothetical protein